MYFTIPAPRVGRICRALLLFAAAVAGILAPRASAAQGLTGALIGTVKDDQGGALSGASVRVASSALIGGSTTMPRRLVAERALRCARKVETGRLNRR